MLLRDHFQGADQSPLEQVLYRAASFLTYVHVESSRLVGMVNLIYIYMYILVYIHAVSSRAYFEALLLTTHTFINI